MLQILLVGFTVNAVAQITFTAMQSHGQTRLTALLHLVPIFLKFGLPAMGLPLGGATAEHLTHMIVGLLIIGFLIVEPHGLARLWSIGKQKLRMWPFPY